MVELGELTTEQVLLLGLMFGFQHSSYFMCYSHYGYLIQTKNHNSLVEKQANSLRIAATLADSENGDCVERLAKELVLAYEAGKEQSDAAREIVEEILDQALFSADEEEIFSLIKIVRTVMPVLWPLIDELQRVSLSEKLEGLLDDFCEDIEDDGNGNRINSGEDDGCSGEDDRGAFDTSGEQDDSGVHAEVGG